MNDRTALGKLSRLAYRVGLGSRWVGVRRRCVAFGLPSEGKGQQIGCIVIINLDRQPRRWHLIARELGFLKTDSGRALGSIAKRFSAVDGRSFRALPDRNELIAEYSLADQFLVDPNHLVSPDQVQANSRIRMTSPEIAVALSHAAVWRQIAAGTHDHTLVLEDDGVFCRRFSREIDALWRELSESDPCFDLLYLSYRETSEISQVRGEFRTFFRPKPGLWQLSGYVLSRDGARKLLDRLPIAGPVDLWINKQFRHIGVVAANTSLIHQRRDGRSRNLYSVLPVLASVGAINDGAPCLFEREKLPVPVFVVGEHGAGLTSMATALSMLGYRCCSDIAELPDRADPLSDQHHPPLFDAYVNAGAMDARRLTRLAESYKNGKFIILLSDRQQTGYGRDSSGSTSPRRPEPLTACQDAAHLRVADELQRRFASVLVVRSDVEDMWAPLCGFLKCRYPSGPYPSVPELGRRKASAALSSADRTNLSRATRQRFDSSPWVMPSLAGWDGLVFDDDVERRVTPLQVDAVPAVDPVDLNTWDRLTDTFPGNLALFRVGNVSLPDAGGARLVVVNQRVGVREYTAGAIASRGTHHYGTFSATIRPAKGPGLITGMFLHRNTPRQEIDVEFLGNDTTKLLTNVYYNPGSDGDRLDYGYRGTPILSDLGFDAADAFHRYSLQWAPSFIRWFVDGHLVSERTHWNPTPVPHLPMRYYINTWPCRSEELAGRISACALPAASEIRSVEVSDSGHGGSSLFHGRDDRASANGHGPDQPG